MAHIQSRWAKGVVEVAAKTIIPRVGLALDEGVREVGGRRHHTRQGGAHVGAVEGLASTDGRVWLRSRIGLEKHVIGGRIRSV